LKSILSIGWIDVVWPEKIDARSWVTLVIMWFCKIPFFYGELESVNFGLKTTPEIKPVIQYVATNRNSKCGFLQFFMKMVSFEEQEYINASHIQSAPRWGNDGVRSNLEKSVVLVRRVVRLGRFGSVGH